MGHPWEHLIEHYQKKVSRPHSRISRDYAPSFIGHARQSARSSSRADRQKDEYKRLLASVFRYVFHLAQYLRETGDRRVRRSAIRAILEEAIERVWRDYQFRDDGSAARRSRLLSAGFRGDGGARLCRHRRRTHRLRLSPFGLGKQAMQRLKDIAVFCGREGPVPGRCDGPGVCGLRQRGTLSGRRDLFRLGASSAAS